MTILRAHAWSDNGELIADVAKLGYLDGERVLDCTYGYGIFWMTWQPKHLVACDVKAEKSPFGCSVDFTSMPFDDERFTAVVCDPPYKMNGTPTANVDERYGVHESTRWQDRMALIHEGIPECLRVTKTGGYFLLKCMDQVCSGQVRWQTDEFTATARNFGAVKVDRFDMLTTPRPQPSGRRQVHAQSNYSTLLVFQKKYHAPGWYVAS